MANSSHQNASEASVEAEPVVGAPAEGQNPENLLSKKTKRIALNGSLARS